jgi:hypothetical protein
MHPIKLHHRNRQALHKSPGGEPLAFLPGVAVLGILTSPLYTLISFQLPGSLPRTRHPNTPFRPVDNIPSCYQRRCCTDNLQLGYLRHKTTIDQLSKSQMSQKGIKIQTKATVLNPTAKVVPVRSPQVVSELSHLKPYRLFFPQPSLTIQHTI